MSPATFGVVSEELDGGIVAITVSGELDMHTAPELEQCLEQAVTDKRASILLDLSPCEFIDSTGIALIVRTWQRIDSSAGEGKGRVVLCCIDHQVRRLLKITGVEGSISMHEEREAALAELRG